MAHRPQGNTLLCLLVYYKEYIKRCEWTARCRGTQRAVQKRPQQGRELLWGMGCATLPARLCLCQPTRPRTLGSWDSYEVFSQRRGQSLTPFLAPPLSGEPRGRLKLPRFNSWLCLSGDRPLSWARVTSLERKTFQPPRKSRGCRMSVSDLPVRRSQHLRSCVRDQGLRLNVRTKDSFKSHGLQDFQELCDRSWG